MALRLWNNCGIMQVKVEALDSTLTVLATIADSVIMYLPITMPNISLPSRQRIDDFSYDYYSNYVYNAAFLGCPYLPITESSIPQWRDFDTKFGMLRYFFPYTIKAVSIPDSTYAIKVTDIGSGIYYIHRDGGLLTFHNASGAEIERYTSMHPPFAENSINLTSLSWCIKEYTINGNIITVNQICAISTRVINNNYEIYGEYSEIPRTYVVDWLNMASEFVPPGEDPYDPGGISGPGGGGGTFDDGSDIIGLPPLPTVSFASTGFTRIYNPTLSELNALANYLWTDTTFLQTVINHLKQLLENPMDAIISLSLVPCQVPNGSPIPVKVMYIDTGVSMAPATTQFVDVDCGTLAVPEYYGSALDYNPYTKIHCYLPYIGQVTLDTDEVMGRTLQVVYRIDIVTGMCAAIILVDQNVLYQFSGHCAINMPINSADFSGYIGAAMTAGKMVAGVVAGATGNLPLAAELIGGAAAHSSTTETFEKTTVRNPATGRQITSGTDTKIAVHKSPGASFGELTRKAVSNTVGSVMGSKLTVEHAGGFTGNSGYLAVRRPYLIIERPRMCNPAEYGNYNGRPSMIYTNLGSCSGYTEVQSIQLNGIPATNPELSELSELLKSGVIL